MNNAKIKTEYKQKPSVARRITMKKINNLKSIRYLMFTLASIILVTSCTNKDSVKDERTAQQVLADSIELEAGQPAKELVQDLYDEMDFQRAVQAYIWATPFVNYCQVMESLEVDFGTSLTKQVIWETSVTPDLKVYTANNTTIYTFGRLDLKKHGAVILDAPAGVLGGINSHWMYPLMDVGPFGPDKGNGGKFLILPPNFDGEIPDGYHVVQSDTYQIIFLLRGIVRDGDTKAAADNVKLTKIYPLLEADNPPEMSWINGSGKSGDMVFPAGYEYFELLAKYLKEEHARPEDKAMLGMLAPLGIGIGKEFKPDKRTKGILERAAKVGNAMSRAIAYSSRDPKADFYGDANHWEKIFLSESPTFEEETYLDIDARVTFSHQASFTAKGMVLKIIGKGSQYLSTYKDETGKWLDGAENYSLHLDPDIPAVNFWSIMVYDTETRSMILNGKENDVGKDGDSDLLKNDDGSIDLYFGPTAPAGKEKNWIKTVPGKGFFMYFRAYGPTESFFDKSWKLNDVTKTK
jgi:hypothetical protein